MRAALWWGGFWGLATGMGSGVAAAGTAWLEGRTQEAWGAVLLGALCALAVLVLWPEWLNQEEE